MRGRVLLTGVDTMRTPTYALLAVVEESWSCPVRGDADTATLQFSDGTTNVLVYVTETERGARRVDGWVDAAALEVLLVQGEREWRAALGPHGRFAFARVPHGVSRISLLVRGADGEVREVRTPRFEA